MSRCPVNFPLFTIFRSITSINRHQPRDLVRSFGSIFISAPLLSFPRRCSLRPSSEVSVFSSKCLPVSPRRRSFPSTAAGSLRPLRLSAFLCSRPVDFTSRCHPAQLTQRTEPFLGFPAFPSLPPTVLWVIRQCVMNIRYPSVPVCCCE